MHGTPHETGLVVRVYRGGSHNADRRDARQGQGAYPVRGHEGRLAVTVQPGARAAEFQVPRADTREERSVFTIVYSR